ncbi:MAG TPA: MarR family transcriptional regulator [Kiloniellaceae bacterium]|nr:MarR family transcriptional regulator [Kiloniellaceae bacterium]
MLQRCRRVHAGPFAPGSLVETDHDGAALTESDKHKLAFQFFNEVGIIQQLASTAFNRRLPEGLHVSHFAVLNHLTRLGDGKTPRALASAFQVTKGTMSHTLAALSERAFIRIEPHATDRRSKLVYLTPQGRRFHRKAIASLDPLFDALEKGLDLDSVIAVLPALRAVRVFLDDNRDL